MQTATRAIILAASVLLAACGSDATDGEPVSGVGAPTASVPVTAAEQERAAESGGDAGAAPADAVREFFEAGKTVDMERTRAAVCAADQASYEGEPVLDEVITSYSIGQSREMQSDLIAVTVEFTDSGGASSTVQVPVYFETGAWSVCWSQGYRLDAS